MIYSKGAFVVAFVFFAFRAPVVGADTWNYVRYLTGERNFYNYDPRPLEPLFVVYREILCSFTSSRFVVMVVNTVVTFAPLYYITKKYSLNPPLTILFFCFLGGLSVYFVGLRQVIALSLLFLFLNYWLENKGHYIKKIVVFTACTVSAYFFHTSTILYAFIFLLSLIPFTINRFVYIVLIIGSALIGMVLAEFDVLNFFSIILQLEFSSVDRLDGYLENEELKDPQSLNILLRFAVFALVIYFYIGKEKLSHPFAKLFLFEVIVYNFLHSVPMIGRICNPLSIFGAIIFTWTMDKYARKTIAQRYLNIIISLIILYYLRVQIIDLSNWNKSDEGRMHPYYFVFEDYRKHPSITQF